MLKNFSEKNRKDVKGVTPQAMDRLVRYEWPGNVRELMNAVERGVVLALSEYLNEEVFPIIPPDLRDNCAPGLFSENTVTDQPLEAVEKTTILKTLASAGGNKSETARRLGITRKTLHKKLKKYGEMPQKS